MKIITSERQVTGLFIFTILVLIVSLQRGIDYVKENFFKDTDTILFIGIYILLVISSIVLFSLVFYTIPTLIKNLIDRNKYCKHKISGGETLGKCLVCKREKEQEKEKNEFLEAEQKRKNIILQEANELRNTEIKRLTEINLTDINLLYRLHPYKFENAIGKMFEKLDYEVTQTKQTNDGGKDLILKKEGKKYLVECKKFGNDKTIGRVLLQNFFGVIIEERAEKGFFVTTSDFKSTAIEYAKKIEKIELINGENLILLMRDVYPDNYNSNAVQVMCKECGEIVQFTFGNTKQNKYCIRGHLVSNNVDKNVISIKPFRTKKYYFLPFTI